MDKKFLGYLQSMYDVISLQDNSSYPLIGVIYPFPTHKFDKQLIKNINLFVWFYHLNFGNYFYGYEIVLLPKCSL